MNKTIFYLSSIALLLSGCKKDKLDLFQTDEIYVEFSQEKAGFSFILSPGITETEVLLPIKMHGLPLLEKREISIEVDTSSTAIEGVHYHLAEKYYMQENVYESTIPVSVIKTADMDEITYTLVLNIQEAPYVYRGEDSQITLSIDNRVTKPSWWGNTSSDPVYGNLLGKYSTKKFEYFIKATGVTDMAGWSYIEMLKKAVIFREWLDVQEPKVTDENGKIIDIELK